MSQHVLIIAGASGIGKEIVIAFVKTGAKVFICDINVKALAAMVQELPGLLTKVTAHLITRLINILRC